MTETIKQIGFRFVLPILGSIVAGAVAAALSCWLMVHLLDSRVTRLEAIPPRIEKLEQLENRIQPLETQMERHEKALERDFVRHEQTVLSLAVKTDDQEKRLTRLETLVGETQALLSEIRTDVKILLRGGQQ